MVLALRRGEGLRKQAVADRRDETIMSFGQSAEMKAKGVLEPGCSRWPCYRLEFLRTAFLDIVQGQMFLSRCGPAAMRSFKVKMRRGFLVDVGQIDEKLDLRPIIDIAMQMACVPAEIIGFRVAVIIGAEQPPDVNRGDRWLASEETLDV